MILYLYQTWVPFIQKCFVPLNSLQTDGRTDDEQQAIRNAQLYSSLLRWGEKRNKISSRNLTLSKQNSCCTIMILYLNIPIALSSCACQKESRMRPYHSYCFRIKVVTIVGKFRSSAIQIHNKSLLSKRGIPQYDTPIPFWTPMANMPEF